MESLTDSLGPILDTGICDKSKESESSSLTKSSLSSRIFAKAFVDSSALEIRFPLLFLPCICGARVVDDLSGSRAFADFARNKFIGCKDGLRTVDVGPS